MNELQPGVAGQDICINKVPHNPRTEVALAAKLG